ncbi:hypothetical protein K432DRAFT_335841, partial [Lepidopterella palustris CBS 459.81]
MSMLRTGLVRQTRLFSTSSVVRKSVVDSAKDAVKKVDRAVSGVAVKGIEKGEQAAEAIKSTMPETTGEAKGKASEVTGQAKGKANEMAGKAKGTAEEVKGK